MKKHLLACAAVFGLAVGAAAPADAQIYVEGQLGYAFESELAYNGLDFDVEGEVAWGGALGWRNALGPVSLELDVLRTSRGYDGFNTSLDTVSVLVNGEIDIPLGTPGFDLYVGAGIGSILVEYDGGSAFPAFSDEEWVFGWQALAGARVAVSPSWALFGEYRYQSAEDANLAGIEVEYSSHSLLFGGRYLLGR